MRKLTLFLFVFVLMSGLSAYKVTRYFIPILYIDSIQFESEKNNYSLYYELHYVSDSIQVEYIKSVQNDSILRKYKYHVQNDTSWLIPIHISIDSIKTLLQKESDKERKKHLINNIEWLRNRYLK